MRNFGSSILDVQYCKQGAILLALKCTLQIVCSFTLLLVFSSVPSLKTTACKMEFHPKIISRVKTCFLLSSRIFLLKVNFTFILKTAWVEKVELARKLSFLTALLLEARITYIIFMNNVDKKTIMMLIMFPR